MVLIATADRKACRRWIRMLQEEFSTHVVHERKALKIDLAHHKPSVLLLDLDLPQLEGIRDVAVIQRLSPATKIILLTSTFDDETAVRALKAGAKGCCYRNTASSLLRKAVKVVEKGEIWAGHRVMRHLLEELVSVTECQEKDYTSQRNRPSDYLSSRQCEIAKLVGKGFSNKEIGNQLRISEKTVKAHMTSIFKKLDASGRLQLALLIRDDYLIDSSSASNLPSITLPF